MRRDRTLAGPREGHTPGWLLSAFGRFTFSPLPYGFQGHLPSLGRGAPWGSRRETCKLRSHPHPSRPSVVPPYPFCPFGTFPPDSGNRPSPLKGEGSGGRPLRRIQKPSFPFVGAGHWPARRCTRRVQEAVPYSPAPAAACSAKAGAAVETHQRKFLRTQGPVARKEFRLSLRFPRAGNFAELLRRDSRKTGSGVRRIWARQCPS